MFHSQLQSWPRKVLQILWSSRLRGAGDGRKIKVVGLLGQRFLETKILLIFTRLTWVSRVRKVIEQFYWLTTSFGFNWGQSYLATMVTTQNCTKMLRNVTFVVQFAYFSTRRKKRFVFPSNFWAAFVIKSNFWLFFEQLLSIFWEIKGNFLENLEQLLESPDQGYRAIVEFKS